MDESQRTSKAGVFAAGDVSAGPASIARAVGDGRRAAFAVHQMLTGTSSRIYALNEENMIEDCDAMGSDTAPYVVQYADIYGIAQYESVPSEKEAENACTKAFAELNLGLTIEQARKEPPAASTAATARPAVPASRTAPAMCWRCVPTRKRNGPKWSMAKSAGTAPTAAPAAPAAPSASHSPCLCKSS